MKYFKRFLLLPAVLLVYSCGGGNNSINKKGIVPQYIIEAQKAFGSEYQLAFNADSSFVICEQVLKSSPKFPQNRISFFIYDIINKKKVFEQTIPDGSVNWENNNAVKINRILGTAQGRLTKKNVEVYFYDVKQDKVIPSITSNKNELN